MNENKFCTRLRRRRMELGLSGKALALRLGISQPYLSQMEKGSRDPSPDLLNKLADVLQIPIDVLWLGKNVMCVREYSETGYSADVGKTKFKCHTCAINEQVIAAQRSELDALREQLARANAVIDKLTKGESR